MTRFWITQRQAVRFVDFALMKMTGGEIFVPRLPKRKLMDLLPEGAQYQVIGLRGVGEKVHETLVGQHELPYTEERQGYYVVHYPFPGFRLPDGARSPRAPVTSDTAADYDEGEFDEAAPEVPGGDQAGPDTP